MKFEGWLYLESVLLWVLPLCVHSVFRRSIYNYVTVTSIYFNCGYGVHVHVHRQNNKAAFWLIKTPVSSGVKFIEVTVREHCR